MKGSPFQRNFGIGSPIKQSEGFGPHNPDKPKVSKTSEKSKLTSDEILKNRFGDGWKNAKAEGYTVVDGKIVSPKGEDVTNPLENT